MRPMRLVLLVALAAAEPLGPMLHQDGYHFRPPRGFHMARLELFQKSHAGAVSLDRDPPGALSAALVDGEGDDAASLLVSVIDADLPASARDEWSAAVTRHLKDRLSLPFELERCHSTPARFECLGTISQQGQARRIVVTAFPGEARHVVMVASVPTARWETFEPVLRESQASFGYDVLAAAAVPRRALWVVALLAVGLFGISVAMWRRRRERQEGALR